MTLRHSSLTSKLLFERALGPAAVAGALLVATLTSAAAQAPPSPHAPAQPSANQPDKRACAQPPLPVAPSQRQGALAGQPPRAATGEAPHLSDQLAKSDGVICPPPGVDPEIRAPAPEVGKMPVIPPPGSPGGNPNVRPK